MSNEGEDTRDPPRLEFRICRFRILLFDFIHRNVLRDDQVFCAQRKNHFVIEKLYCILLLARRPRHETTCYPPRARYPA
jgi:hypothetical protein